MNVDELNVDLVRFKKRKPVKVGMYLIFTLLGLYGGVFLSLNLLHSHPLILIVTVPMTTIGMCQSYVLLHDCGHKSLFAKPNWNQGVGHIMGFGILIPHSLWQFIHDAHHRNVGNLEQRAFNPEIWTLTKKEYQETGMLKRLAYRFMRSRWTRFTLTPTVNLGLMFRLVSKKFSWAANISVIIHDILYVVLVLILLKYYTGFELIMSIYLPLVLFYFIASYTFYAQHQFENTYWEHEQQWNYQKASFYGASCIEAPLWFRFLTGNVVYHNLHHLQSGIPFYQLHDAHQELKRHYNYQTYGLSEIWDMLDCKLWDEELKKLVPYPD